MPKNLTVEQKNILSSMKVGSAFAADVAHADAVGGIGASLVHPTPILCTDNAVMIACRGYFMYQNGEYSPLDLNAVPSLKLG